MSKRTPPASRAGNLDYDVTRPPAPAPARPGSSVADLVAAVWTRALAIARASNEPELHPHQHAETDEL